MEFSVLLVHSHTFVYKINDILCREDDVLNELESLKEDKLEGQDSAVKQSKVRQLPWRPPPFHVTYPVHFFILGTFIDNQ